MIFTSIPDNFSSIQQSLIYELSTQGEPLEELTVEIYNAEDDSLLGVKHLFSVAEASVDVAPILREKIQPQLPTSSSSTSLVEYNADVTIYLRVGDTLSPRRQFVYAQADTSQPLTLLSTQIEQRMMAPDECDWIAVLLTQSTGCAVVVQSFGKDSYTRRIELAQTGQRLFSLSAAATGDCNQIELSFVYYNTVVKRFCYEVKRNLKGARRIGWINHQAAPELYTFPMRKSILLKSTRKHLATLWGREAGAVESDGELKIISAYEPQAQLDALAEIISSRQVWLMKGCVRQNVDLLTERILRTPSEKLGFIELDIRAAREGEEL